VLYYSEITVRFNTPQRKWVSNHPMKHVKEFTTRCGTSDSIIDKYSPLRSWRVNAPHPRHEQEEA
jgi:hypothetical protein